MNLFSIYSVRYSEALGFKFTLLLIVRRSETVYLRCSRFDFPLFVFSHLLIISSSHLFSVTSKAFLTQGFWRGAINSYCSSFHL